MWWRLASINRMLWGSDTDLVSCWQSKPKSHHATNAESSSDYSPMYRCSTCIFISAPAERRGPLHSIGIFYPLLFPTAIFFSFQRELAVKKKNKNVAGRKITESCFRAPSFPLFVQNEMAYCNSKSKSVGAVLFRLLRPVQEISFRKPPCSSPYFKDTQTHTRQLQLLLCLVHYLFSVHQNRAGE